MEAYIKDLERQVLQLNGGRVLSRILQLNGLCGPCLDPPPHPLALCERGRGEGAGSATRAGL